MRLAALVVAILASPPLGAVRGQTNAGATLRLLEARVDTLMAKHAAPSGPGAGVLVVQDGQIALEKGYALAVVEERTTIRADTPVRFIDNLSCLTTRA